MKTINAGATFGNFTYEVEGEVDEATLHRLANLGLLQVIQRGPSSAAEKEMAGYEKRPAGFKRDSIGFSEAGANTLAKHLGKITLPKDEELGLDAVDVILAAEVLEYVPTSGADPKYVAERAKIAEKVAAGPDAVAKLKKTVGYDGEDETEFARAIRSYLAELAKGL